MRRLRFVCATLPILLGLLPAPAVSRGLPPPPNGIIPPVIYVTGVNGGGVPDPLGTCTIRVLDLANNPIPGAVIVLDFSGCADLRLCALAYDPGAIVDCALRSIARITDADGYAIFHVVGASIGTPGTGSPVNCARVYADGYLLGSPSVAIYDLEGRNGLGPADLSAWLTDFFSGNYAARSDYDGSGAPLGPSDLARWLTAFFAGGSVTGCPAGSACP